MSYTATTNTVPVPGHKVPDLPIDSTGNRPLNIQKLNLFIVISEEVVPLEKANSLLLQHNFPDLKIDKIFTLLLFVSLFNPMNMVRFIL